MRNWKRWTWLQHVAVAAFYLAAYSALRSVSYSFWQLTASLRLLCLLFLPRRYWPALAVGEMLGLGKISYECYESLGPSYAILSLFPRITLEMPIVDWFKRRWGLIGAKRDVRIGFLLQCILFTSAATAACDYFLVWVTPTPAGQELPTLAWAAGFFVGKYLGALTLVPLALMLWQTKGIEDWRSWGARLSANRLVIDSLLAVFPALILLTWIAAHSSGQLAIGARFAMFLPVAALTVRHGWHGSALAGATASICLALVMPPLLDPITTPSLLFMGFCLTMLLMLGARIATLNAREDTDRKDVQLALQAAQQGLYMGELRMRHAADTIDQIATSLLNVQGHLLERLRYLLSPAEEQHFSKQVNVSKYEAFQLANRLAPRALQIGGLSLSLRDATLAHAFTSANVTFQCDVRGDGDGLSARLQLALYRLVCEASAFLYEQATLSHAHLRVRVGYTKGRRWVAVRMDGLHATHTQDLMPASMACEHFKNQVGATGVGFTALRDQAYIYGGTAHLRSTAHGTRLALLLHDAEARLERVQ